MANFLEVLQNYKGGEKSLEDLLSEIEQLLDQEGISVTWMLNTLTADHAQNPLPAHAFEAVKLRLNLAISNNSAYQAYSGRSGETAEVVADSVPEECSLGQRQSPQTLDKNYLLKSTAQASAVQTKSSPIGPSTSQQDEDNINGEGDTLNERFELKKRIGSGNTGMVYKALDRRKLEAVARNPYVAVKILKKKFSSHHSWLPALQRKVQSCQHLVHPNIGRVYDFNRDREKIYVTVEYLYGESLAQMIRADDFAGIPFQQAQPIVNAMGRALAFAHQRDIIHYDFKPSNVFLTDASELKVTDFFITPAYRSLQPITAEHLSEPEDLDIQNTEYASPERLEQLDPDPRDDVFSLACTTYELLTGRHPFNGMLATQAWERRIKPPHPKALKPRQWKALKSALRFDRSERTPTVEQFLADFNATTRIKQYGLPLTAAVAAGAAGMMAFGINYFFAKLNTPVGTKSSSFENSVTDKRTPPPLTAVVPIRNTDPPTGSQSITKMTADSRASVQDVPAQLNANSASPATANPPGKQFKLPVTAERPSDASTEPEQTAISMKQSVLEVRASDQSELEWSREENTVQDELEALVKAEIQLRVTDLLARAEQQMEALQLTTPAGDSAFESYQQILELMPEHGGALKGIEKIKSQYQQWVEAATQNGELKLAQIYLGRAIAIAPDDPVLIAEFSNLNKVKPLANERVTKAAGQLVQTSLLDTTHQRRQVLDSLLLKTQHQLEAHQLVRPQGNNAAETFSKVLQLDPANRWAREGLQTIAIRLEAMARTKQQEGDLQASLSIINDGLKVLPDQLRLRALKDVLDREIAGTTKEPHTTEQPDR